MTTTLQQLITFTASLQLLTKEIKAELKKPADEQNYNYLEYLAGALETRKNQLSGISDTFTADVNSIHTSVFSHNQNQSLNNLLNGRQ